MTYSLPSTPAADETRLQSPESGLEAHQRLEGAWAGPPPPTANLGQGSPRPGGLGAFCFHTTQICEGGSAEPRRWAGVKATEQTICVCLAPAVPGPGARGPHPQGLGGPSKPNLDERRTPTH